MSAIKNVTRQKPKPRRKHQEEDYYVAYERGELELEELRDRNEELKNDNLLLRKLVAQLSLEKLKAEMDL